MSPHSSRLMSELQKHDVLSSTTDRYLVLEVVNRGSYGIVAKCISLRAGKSTAVKIHFGDHIAELEMLQEIMELDPENTNLVKFIESFTCQGMFCIAFEMLDKSLWDFIAEIRTPLSLNEIRPITHQLLVALEALKSRGIIHTDLKPDSVMLVNHQDQPFKLNLSDFGLAVKASETKVGMELQPLSYRAPEVMLGLPLSEAMDMWSLGCVLAFLFFGVTIFPGNTTYSTVAAVCDLLGQPADHLLDAGMNTSEYFILEQGSRWRLKTPEEYEDTAGVQPETPDWFVNSVRNLEDAMFSSKGGSIELKDRMEFIDLLKRLFNQDAKKRITPSQALKHNFLTMTHLENNLDTSSYAEAAFELMDVSTLSNSDDSSDEDSSSDVIICNNSTAYRAVDILGEGGFGEVYMCVNKKTSEKVAIKIMTHSEDYIREVKMLQKIKTLDPDKTNMVKFIDSFIFQARFHITFEMLDRNLFDFVWKTKRKLSLKEIRTVAHQLLIALEALKSHGIIHTDLKPDNVMLVNHQDQPFRVKLIDFGLAVKASKVKVGMHMQIFSYRAPEVMLWLPLSEAVDMWSLGCVLAFLLFGTPLFPGETTYDTMKVICYALGQPADYLLDAGMNTDEYFIQEQGSRNPGWRLKTPEEYEDTIGFQPTNPKWFIRPGKNLEMALNLQPMIGELEDRLGFLDIIHRMLDMDAERRITPTQALKHNFLTMTDLENNLDTSSYAEAAFELMAVCPLSDSDDSSDEDSSSDVIICNNSTEYRAVNILGEGGFGEVYMCVNKKTSEKVAIKIMKHSEDYIREVKMLQEIKTLDPDKTNMVKFIDSFIFQARFHITFEMLDRNLFDFVWKTKRILSLKEIRTVAHQLLIAFEALKSHGIIHTDLKPDNVMLVNHQDQPFRVKLIDFGLAVKASKVKVGMDMHIFSYRAPEVMLWLPLSEAVDMWSLGCVLAFLLFGIPLFPGETTYDTMKVICYALGQPADYLLDAGMNTDEYFIQEQGSRNPGWRLKTPEEYEDTIGFQPTNPKWFIRPGKNLEMALNLQPMIGELEDRLGFLDIIHRMLDMDAERRITPTQALSHNFITAIQELPAVTEL